MAYKNLPLIVSVSVFGLLVLAVFIFGPGSDKSIPAKDEAATRQSGESASSESGGSPPRQGILSMLPSALLKKHAEAPQIFGMDGPVTMDQIPRSDFRRELLRLNDADRDFALRKLGESKVPVEDVSSLHVSQGGQLYYACKMLATVPDPLPPEATDPSQSKVPISSPPACSSRPGSPNTLYLNFSGYVVQNTWWNSDYPIYEALPYDLDGDITTFNEFEQKQIVEIWKRVSEDFKPFNINVTTVRPADLATSTQISHAIITKNFDAKGRPMPAASAGGVAWLGIFGTSNAIQPSLNYYNRGGALGYMAAEVVSHETGHTLGLHHDGQTNVEYYRGHGTDQQSWAPIMGAAYGKNFAQWTTGNQSYKDANNPENDLQVITGKLGIISDDVGGATANATEIKASAGKFSTSEYMIGLGGDVDVFKIVPDSSALNVSVASFKTNSPSAGSNLGLKAEILSSNGSVLATNDSGRNLVNLSSPTTVGETYYIRVSGTGCGNSTATKPSGFLADASLGTYTISGTMSAASLDGNATTSTALSALSLSTGTMDPRPSFRYKVLPAGNATIAAISSAPANSVALSFEASPANAAALPTSVAIQPTPEPTPTPSPTPPSANPTPTPDPGPLTLTHSITRSWGSGMAGQLLLKNISKSPVSNWSLAFDYPSVISSITGGNWTREIAARTFSAAVPGETSSITVNWTTTNQTATSRVRLNSGNFSTYNGTGNFSLSEGENTIMIEVTAPDNVTKGYHRLTVTRQKGMATVDAETKLSAVSLSAGSLTPSFSANTSTYSANITNSTPTISINATKATAGGKIEAKVGNGVFVTLKSGSPSQLLTMPVGATVVELKVTSASGNASSSYFVNVSRAGSSKLLSNLVASWNGSGLTISPAFSSNTLNYTATVANSVSSITMTPTAVDKTSSLAVRAGGGNFTNVTSGSLSIPIFPAAGANTTVEVSVLSDDNSNNSTYSLNVARLAAPVTSPVASASLNGTTLNGTADTRSTSAAFQLGTTSGFGTTLPASLAGGNASATTSALLPSTLYYFRLTSTYGGITDYGNTTTFITPAASQSANLTQVFAVGANATDVSGAKFSDFGYSAINNNADTAFQGFMTYGVPGSKIFGGVWTTLNGTTRLSAGIGASAPDTTLFSGIGSPMLDDSRRMTFTGNLKVGFGGVTANSSAGIWQVASNGTITKIARAGGNATGANGTVYSTFDKLVAGNGGVAFTGTLAGGSATVNSTNSTGLWAQDSSGNLVLVARTSANPTPTLKSFTIFNAESGQNGQTRHFNNTGDLVLTATFGNGSAGIYRVTKSGNFSLNGTTPVVAVGSAVPGVTGGNFTSLGNPIINDSGVIAFKGTFSGNGVSSGNNTGIFRYSSNGTGALVARTGVANSGNLTFQSISAPLLNNANGTAFTGSLVVGGNVSSSNATGVWSVAANGTLTTVARVGDAVPGVENAKFASFTQVVFPKNGSMAFTATLQSGLGGVTASNNTGLWAQNSSGNLVLVARTGNSLSIGGNPKTISSLEVFSSASANEGVGCSANAAGDILIKLKFTDTTSALFKYKAE